MHLAGQPEDEGKCWAAGYLVGCAAEGGGGPALKFLHRVERFARRRRRAVSRLRQGSGFFVTLVVLPVVRAGTFF